MKQKPYSAFFISFSEDKKYVCAVLTYKNHTFDLSLPGGKQKPIDLNPYDTACRECLEEGWKTSFPPKLDFFYQSLFSDRPHFWFFIPFTLSKIKPKNSKKDFPIFVPVFELLETKHQKALLLALEKFS
ncbi:MAG: hypothetical protein NZZ41_05410 [Candidatus Dojkabacteria bacterium]|nr:hypothetical protein [Candidatus Dojkabacteria bacterium]